MSDKIQALKRWMKEKGCIIHPHVDIPQRFDGVLGIGTNGPLPHKTLIIAVPSNLILSVTKCYNDPTLKRLFQRNDELFDYQATEDAEFNVLCVFMMYHKLNAENSPWREYIEAISEPQTAVDWSNYELKGLNKSIIEEVVHVRRQCQKLQKELIAYLMKRKEFRCFQEKVLKETFQFCYRAVMNRSFGYYFNETCLIPVADLVNHSCQTVDHQLVSVPLERGDQFYEGYFPRKDKINLDLIGIETKEKKALPFRHRFLVQNQIVENEQETITKLDRKKINGHLYKWNKDRLKKGEKLENLHFCSEDEEEDNDTDEDFQYEKEREFQQCKKNQKQQMEQFVKHYVKVEKYRDVEKQLEKMERKDEGKEEEDVLEEKVEKQTEGTSEKSREKEEEIKEYKHCENEGSKDHPNKEQKQDKKDPEEKEEEKPKEAKINPFEGAAGKGVPIQMMESSSEQQEDEQQWGLKQGSYFTMSTSNPIPGNTQIFNSYGSRTNKFLMVWYGFTYPDNLYDSVTVRLHVKFGPLRPARQIVLDTYVGGQGLSFKKNEDEVVQQTELSRQFRFKRSHMNERLIVFLRLFLMNYYKGEDLYKLFVTFPASANYELFVLNYYKDIIQALYERYPLEVIEELEQEQKLPQNSTISHKIRYKIIYLTEQRKLLDLNLLATKEVIAILEKCRGNGGKMERSMYQNTDIEVLRVIKNYLVQYQQQTQYILYEQKEMPIQEPSEKMQNLPQKVEKKEDKEKDISKPKVEQVQQEQQEWEDVEQEQAHK